MELLIKDIKLNMFDELKETTNSDLKRVRRMMYEQTENDSEKWILYEGTAQKFWNRKLL